MKNKLTGCKDIFVFSLVQSLKAKSMIISNIILCLIVLISVPAITLINNKDDEKEKTKTTIENVKVVDLTGLEIIENIDFLNSESLYEEDENHIYENISYEQADIDYSKFGSDYDVKEIYEFEKDSKYVYLQLTYVEEYFDIQVIFSKDSAVDEEDAQDYSSFVDDNFRALLLDMMELTEEQENMVDSSVVTTYQRDIEEAEANEGEPVVKKDAKTEQTKNNIIYVTLMVVMFVLAFGGERIAMSIVTEKASKVMEFLMTSVKPMAIVVGKTLSSLVVLFVQGALLIVAFGGSIVLNGIMFNDGKIELPSFLIGIFNMKNFEGCNIATVVIAILILLLGFIFYAMVAALCGASVSKIDEMAEGVKMFTMLLIISAYVSLFIVTSSTYDGDSAIRLVALLAPITSLFLTPTTLVTGYATLSEGLIALGILIVSVYLLVKFVANVYESMIYYSGTPMKLKDIINISKQNKIKKDNAKEE